jgi:2-amino-4-hydroxy-6-hydroxymethyldihydropteridine diphosphokinase
LGTVEARSRLYRTDPWGGIEQPDFINAVVALRTDFDPASLLRALQSLERRLGRRPGVRWGPRAIDLDLLTFDEMQLEGAIVLPHPRLRERAFVLVPLAEISPDRVIAGRKIASVLAELSSEGIERLPDQVPPI